jgi:hypothetical protein
MSYRFKSKAAGPLFLLGPSGEQLLRAIGKEPSPTGLIAPAAMPAAIEAIEAAIALEDTRHHRIEEDTEDRLAEDREPSHSDGVTLRQRAWPFVEMMKRAHHEGEPIFWGV